jgi:hypothetical protein
LGLDGPNLYHFNFNDPVNGVDPTGLHSVFFDGAYAYVFNDEGKRIYKSAAESGKGPFMNKPLYQYLPKKGPLPEGRYFINPREFTRPYFLQYLKWALWDRADWGRMRIPIHPSDEKCMKGRSGFFIHGGLIPGSAGCIDLGTNELEFYDLLKNHEGLIDVWVDYGNYSGTAK